MTGYNSCLGFDFENEIRQARNVVAQPFQEFLTGQMHEVDFKVFGDDMQYVEVKSALFGGEGWVLGGPGRILDGDRVRLRSAGGGVAAPGQEFEGGLGDLRSFLHAGVDRNAAVAVPGQPHPGVAFHARVEQLESFQVSERVLRDPLRVSDQSVEIGLGQGSEARTATRSNAAG